MEIFLKYILLISLLFLSIFEVKSQRQDFNLKGFYVELNPILGNNQIKDYPLKEGRTSIEFGYGGELNFGLTFKGNWNFSIGGNYFAQEFISSKPFEISYVNPNNEPISSANFSVENLNNPFSNNDVSFTLGFDGINCDDTPTFLPDQEKLSMVFISTNLLRQVGIPISVEKLIGRKATKLYIGLGVTPTFVIGKTEIQKYRNTGIKVSHNEICSFHNEILTYQFSVTQENIVPENQNIEMSRLDVNTEIGLQNKGKENTFKLALFYRQSISGFTTVSGTTYQGQIVGLKFGLRKNKYRK